VAARIRPTTDFRETVSLPVACFSVATPEIWRGRQKRLREKRAAAVQLSLRSTGQLRAPAQPVVRRAVLPGWVRVVDEESAEPPAVVLEILPPLEVPDDPPYIGAPPELGAVPAWVLLDRYPAPPRGLGDRKNQSARSRVRAFSYGGERSAGN